MGQSHEPTHDHPARHGEASALPADFDHDPGRFAANQLATQNFSMVGDVHDRVADRLAETTIGPILDVGGGNGTLTRSLARHGRTAIVVDRADQVSTAPRPAVQADATRLPFRDECFAAVAALWMLYYLHRPELALVEATRVLRPAGTFVACTSSRYNDPEFASVCLTGESRSVLTQKPRRRSWLIISRSPRSSGGICLRCGSPTPPRSLSSSAGGTKRRASFPARSFLEHTLDRHEARLSDLGSSALRVEGRGREQVVSRSRERGWLAGWLGGRTQFVLMPE